MTGAQKIGELAVKLAEAREDRDKIKLLDQMCKDLLDAVSHLYGPDGIGKVVAQMKRMNRAREDRKEIDALEKMLRGRP